MRNVTTYTVAAGLAAALLFTGAGCSSSAPTASDTSTQSTVAPAPVAAVDGYMYYDQTSKFHFRMQVPKDWEKDESPDTDNITTAFYAPLEDENDEYRENVVITAIQIPADEDVSLTDFANAANDGLKNSITGLATTDVGPVTVNGVKGEKYTFTGDIDNDGEKFKVKGSEVFVINNGVGYNFTFGAANSKFDTTTPTFDKILSTVEFK